MKVRATMTEGPIDRDRPAENTAELLARHRAGDAEALRRLIELCYPRVERIVRVRLGSALRARETVADVVQDVFVRVLEGLDGYEPRSNARWIDWVARLAQNEISNHARHERAQKRESALADLVRSHAHSAATWDIPADTTGVPSKVSRREEEELADQCLGELSEPHREVILLRDYAGGDFKSIAEMMQRPSAEACQELHCRALLELARRVQRRG